jgi:glucokinase
MLLVGDMGGTKTVLAVFSPESGPHVPLYETTYPSAHYPSLEAIIREFVKTFDEPIDRACFGVAGPIFGGPARITNISWEIDETNLKAMFAWDKVTLINDLQSVGYAIPVLEPADIHTLNAGVPAPGKPIAVLAPGTGLGEGYLTCGSDGNYTAHASEGSHVSFGPTNPLQMDLLTYMREKKGYDHVSYERVCSGGLGIPNLYAFLKDTRFAAEPGWLAAQLAGCEDPTPVIFAAAQDTQRPCELCQAVLRTFVDILAAEAGNLALKVMAFGGIYLGGGISPRILPYFSEPSFLTTLRNKGRFADVLATMPVHIILNSKAGLLGAAAYGLR